MLVINNKTEWMRIAAECNFFGTEEFIWIDFGIFHVFNNDILLFNQCIKDLTLKNVKPVEPLESLKFEQSYVRIAGCWNTTTTICHPSLESIFTNISWYFAGGVFGGDKKSLITFANLTKEKCISIISTRNHLMWEVNIWYLVFLDLLSENNHSELVIDWYHADHNSSIIANF